MFNPYEKIQSIFEEVSKIKKTVDEIRDQQSEEVNNKRYTVKEAAKRANVSELSMRNYIKRGYLNADRLGKRILIKHSDLYNAFGKVKSLKYRRD